MKLLSQLANDERGAIISIEMILTATIFALGCLVGLTTFRDSVVQEFGDLSASVSSLNHGYRVTDISFNDTIDNVQSSFNIMESSYTDESNFCEPAILDPANAPPMCMEISDALIIDENERVR